MSVSLERENLFLKRFQNSIIRGDRLLRIGNHKWANKLFKELYFELEKNPQLDVPRRHQLIQLIINSWWRYINSLIEQKDEKIKEFDLIRYIDAYKRFFSFLSKLDDLSFFNKFCLNLLKTFIKIGEDLSKTGIAKFINSFSVKVKEKGDYQELIELQILLMFLREEFIPTEFYNFSIEFLGKTMLKLEPNKRALFLYAFIENINIKYQLMEDSQEFLRKINKILVNRIPNLLKEDFGKLSRVSINERNFSSIFKDFEELIYYMNNIGLDNWIIIIVKYLFSKIQEFQSSEDAINYARKFIDLSISRNKFEVVFSTFDFLENVFEYKSDVGYNRVLIEWWIEACNKFVNTNDKFLLLSLEKLNNHLKIPHRSSDIFHFFYSCNYLWQIKSQFLSVDDRNFWQMMFYRALFEEKDFNLAKKIIYHLDKQIQSHLTGIEALYKGAKLSEMKKYSFDEESITFGTYDENIIIKQIILRIDSRGAISYRLKSSDNQIVDGKLIAEYWNDAKIIEIYDNIISDNQEKKYNFSMTEFGRLLYIFLPKSIREFINKLGDPTLNFIPEVYFVLDKMTIPFQLIYVNNFFMLKISSSYKIGEPSLAGILFKNEVIESKSPSVFKKYNVLIIESLNSRGPVKWNEKNLKKELLFPFIEGMDELKHITNFFNNRIEIRETKGLTGKFGTREEILSCLSQGTFHIIHFVGNIFYSKSDPKDSFFLTNDNNKVSFKEIYKALIQNPNNPQPLICCNTQIYDEQGKRLNNIFRIAGSIFSQFDYNRITGIISRTYPIFNDETKELITNFYSNLFNNKSQGVALLKARQECMAKKATELAELRWTADEEIMKISLAITSYEIFGEPWKKL